jgi:HEAT repeat protein
VRFSDPRIKPAIIKALDDPDFHVVEIAIMAIGHLKAVEATNRLTSLLHQPSYTYIAARALADIGTDVTISLLMNLLKDPDSLKRLCATSALGFVRNERLIEPLKEMLSDEDEHVRQAAEYSLANIENLLVEMSQDECLDDESDPELEVVPPF